MLRTRLLGKRERELTMVFESLSASNTVSLSMQITSLTCASCRTRTGNPTRPMTGLDNLSPRSSTATQKYTILSTRREAYSQLWLPMLETNNRSYLTVAIGCTGWKHRSVYIAEQLGRPLRSRGKNVQSRHRTLEKRKP